MTTRWINGGKALIHGLEGNLTVPLIGEQGRTLKLINNYTVMFSNKSKENKQPVSTIPHHTVNSTLDWQVNEKLSAQLQAIHYGKQKPRTLNFANSDVPVTGTGLDGLGSYTMVNLSSSYAFTPNSRLSVGITNLFDKRIQRKSNSSANAGAATYNEPGRGFYLSYMASF
jgi:ferric enterobactin receptor